MMTGDFSPSSDASLDVWMLGSGAGAGRLSSNSNLSSFCILSTFFDFAFTPVTEGIPGSGVPRFSSRVFILPAVKYITVHKFTDYQ